MISASVFLSNELPAHKQKGNNGKNEAKHKWKARGKGTEGEGKSLKGLEESGGENRGSERKQKGGK